MRFCLTYPMHNIFRRHLLSETYSDISDQDLDQLVRQVQQQHPGVGIRLLKGHLSQVLVIVFKGIESSFLFCGQIQWVFLTGGKSQ